MTKANTTYVAQDKVMAIVTELGLEVQEQAGFIKVKGPSSGRQVYVAKTKQVGRIDISNFVFEGPGVVDLKGESIGAVKQQLDFSLPEADILANFRAVLEHMKTLPAAVKAPRPGKAPTDPAQATTEGTAPAQEDPRLKRLTTLRLIRKISQDKGREMNAELVEELQQLEAETSSPT